LPASFVPLQDHLARLNPGDLAATLERNAKRTNAMFQVLFDAVRPLTEAELIEAAAVGVSATTIAHHLGRVPLGIWPLRDTCVGLRMSQAPDAQNVYLIASTAGTVTFYVVPGGE
jgi:hypothetical protein